jgi:hypothetical protein
MSLHLEHVVPVADDSGTPITFGDATAAKQDLTNTKLDSIDGHVDAVEAKLDQIHTDLTAATPAGANIIGKVGIDQTTPGTSNAVAVIPVGVTYTDRSGTVTAGGTAQTAMAANASRKGLWVQNVSTGDLYINSVAAASSTVSAGSGSLKIVSGAYWEPPAHGVPTGAISVYGATTGQAWVAREW